MPQIKKEKREEVEKRILDAIQHYKHSKKRSIRTSAETFGIAYSTLQGRLTGRQSRAGGHVRLQVLSENEEKSIVE